jgi:hypothetical protein
MAGEQKPQLTASGTLGNSPENSQVGKGQEEGGNRRS